MRFYDVPFYFYNNIGNIHFLRHNKSFALGISLGIAGACVIVLLGYMYRSHLEKSDDEHLKNSDDEEGEGIEMGIEVTDLPDGTDDRQNDSETKQTESVTGSASAFTFDAESAACRAPA